MSTTQLIIISAMQVALILFICYIADSNSKTYGFPKAIVIGLFITIYTITVIAFTSTSAYEQGFATAKHIYTKHDYIKHQQDTVYVEKLYVNVDTTYVNP